MVYHKNVHYSSGIFILVPATAFLIKWFDQSLFFGFLICEVAFEGKLGDVSQFINVVTAFDIVLFQGPEVVGDYISLSGHPVGKRSRSSMLLRNPALFFDFSSLKLTELLSYYSRERLARSKM